MRNGETIGPALLELPRTEVRPPNIGSWEEARKGFDWSVAERELGWGRGDPVNIGWHLSDRICRLGRAQKPALLWEGADGQERRYTFDDLRVLSNTIAAWLARAGSRARRARLPLPRPRPRALPRLRRHPEDGRRRPAALLGVRRGVARHAPRRRRDLRRRHPAQAPAEGAARPRRSCPTCGSSSSSTPGTRSSGRARSRSTSTPSRASRASRSSPRRPRRRRSSTTPRARPASRRARSTSTARSSPST